MPPPAAEGAYNESDACEDGGDGFLGSEWWVQMRSCSSDIGESKEEDAAAEALAVAGGEADASSIAFHFDCDEGTPSSSAGGGGGAW